MSLEIDPELTAIDAESARSSRRKRLEPVSVSRRGHYGHYDILLGQSHLPRRARRLGYGESERQADDILHAQATDEEKRCDPRWALPQTAQQQQLPPLMALAERIRGLRR